ncbi:Ycf66 family protein [Baaleninema sp.]|uniref:Ycf66 family protein n=1 Tax=Baaleninema sp. TaxID=3101197 RepID=UPI003D053F14
MVNIALGGRGLLHVTNVRPVLAQVAYGFGWGSLMGIALVICGVALYLLRSTRPNLARDHDIFFAAVALLCGGILFFQGWRLDPILQFGQFLMTGSAVFFAVESIRLRGIVTQQAKRNTPIVDEEREVSPDYQAYEYEAEFEEIEPYEPYPPNRRIPGSRDRRSTRDAYGYEDEPRRPPTRRSSGSSGRRPPSDATRKPPRRRPPSAGGRPPVNLNDDTWGDAGYGDGNRPPSRPSRRPPSRPSGSSPSSSRRPRPGQPRPTRPSTEVEATLADDEYSSSYGRSTSRPPQDEPDVTTATYEEYEPPKPSSSPRDADVNVDFDEEPRRRPPASRKPKPPVDDFDDFEEPDVTSDYNPYDDELEEDNSSQFDR